MNVLLLFENKRNKNKLLKIIRLNWFLRINEWNEEKGGENRIQIDREAFLIN